VVLQPDRILIEWPIIVELEMIVVVIGDALVLVLQAVAVKVVVQAVSTFLLIVLGIGHQKSLLTI
jgi:hypothetical protein